MDIEFTTNAVGVSHPNDDGTSRQRIIRRLSIGNQVHLVREPYSPYDPNQVGLFVESRERSNVSLADVSRYPQAERKDHRGELVKIGHLARDIAAKVAPEMDRGIRWRAIVGDLPGRTTKGVVLLLGRETSVAAVAEVDAAQPTETLPDATAAAPASSEHTMNLDELFAAFDAAEAAQKNSATAQATAAEALAAAQAAKAKADAELAQASSQALAATEALITGLQSYKQGLRAG